jgi:hypothetical protein
MEVIFIVLKSTEIIVWLIYTFLTDLPGRGYVPNFGGFNPRFVFGIKIKSFLDFQCLQKFLNVDLVSAAITVSMGKNKYFTHLL